MIQKDGSVLNTIPEKDGPWTNGDTCRPTPKSAELRTMGGNLNRWCLTIEAEGDTNVPYTVEQRKSIDWQIAQWMLVYDIPLNRVLSHASINQCSRPHCPGEQHMLQILDDLAKAGL
jgi:hypothetical protein